MCAAELQAKPEELNEPSPSLPPSLPPVISITPLPPSFLFPFSPPGFLERKEEIRGRRGEGGIGNCAVRFALIGARTASFDRHRRTSMSMARHLQKAATKALLFIRGDEGSRCHNIQMASFCNHHMSIECPTVERRGCSPKCKFLVISRAMGRVL